MTDSEFDRTARAWLADGPNRISDRALQAALDEIHVTRQRRAWWPAQRQSRMFTMLRIAVAVGADRSRRRRVRAPIFGRGPGPESDAHTDPDGVDAVGESANWPRWCQAPTSPQTIPGAGSHSRCRTAGRGTSGARISWIWARPDGPRRWLSAIFDTVYADPCNFNKGPMNPPPGPSVDDLVAALVGLPILDVTHADRRHHRRLPRESNSR